MEWLKRIVAGPDSPNETLPPISAPLADALHNAARAQSHQTTAQELQRIAAQRQNQLNQAYKYNHTDMQSAQNAEGGPGYFISGSMVNKKAQAAFDLCANQLPFAVCAKIHGIRLSIDPRAEKCFAVTYANGHRVEFDNMDTFPTDADIARICLEAP